MRRPSIVGVLGGEAAGLAHQVLVGMLECCIRGGRFLLHFLNRFRQFRRSRCRGRKGCTGFMSVLRGDADSIVGEIVFASRARVPREKY